MARIVVNASFIEAKLLLNVVSAIQNVRALNSRCCNIMDLTRAGGDFSALGTALGCSAAEAATLYSRMRAIETTMNGADFVNLSDVDQG